MQPRLRCWEPVHRACDEAGPVGRYPAGSPDVRVIVEVAAADKPEELVDMVGADPDLVGDADDRFECLVVTWGRRRQPKATENGLEVDIRLAAVEKSELLEEVAREREAEAVDLVAQEHRQRRADAVVLVEDLDPRVEVVRIVELAQERGSRERRAAEERPDAARLTPDRVWQEAACLDGIQNILPAIAKAPRDRGRIEGTEHTLEPLDSS